MKTFAIFLRRTVSVNENSKSQIPTKLQAPNSKFHGCVSERSNLLKFVIWIFFGVWISGFGISVEAASLRAGAASVDITPTNLPIRTAGNLTLTVVNKIHDPLHARAVVLDDGATRLAIAVVDSCMIAREDFDTAKQLASRATGISVSNMLISSTHTHTAPAAYGCHGNDAEPEYRAYIIPRIADSIVQAARNLQPARVGWGKTDLQQDRKSVV